MSSDQAARRRCFAKRIRGNAYPTESEANRAASELGLKYRKLMRAFRCRFCPNWHVGSLDTYTVKEGR